MARWLAGWLAGYTYFIYAQKRGVSTTFVLTIGGRAEVRSLCSFGYFGQLMRILVCGMKQHYARIDYYAMNLQIHGRFMTLYYTMSIYLGAAGLGRQAGR